MKGLVDITTMTDDRCADENGIGRFSYMMLRKLEAKRAQGRSGWNRPSECLIADLREWLREHVDKGDPVDIANYAMMIWNREHPNG